jgi:hypothetical protein
MLEKYNIIEHPNSEKSYKIVHGYVGEVLYIEQGDVGEVIYYNTMGLGA